MVSLAFSSSVPQARSVTSLLHGEMDRACAAVQQPHLDAMISLGVNASAIAKLGCEQQPFGVAHIADLGGGRFSFFSGGQPRVIMPVIEQGEIIDLIAWQTFNPGKWLWRNGVGDFLGRDLIARSQWASNHALKLVATPLEWLRAGGDAVCILNWKAPRSELEQIRFVDEIIVTDADLGRHLAKVMATPRPIPRITIIGGKASA